MTRHELRAILIAAVALVALIIGTVFALNASAQSITLHNNYGSDRVVTAKDSAGRLHYLGLGQTATMGSSMRIYVAIGTCLRYGSPVNGVSFGRVCATDSTPTSWVASKSLWVDVVSN